MLRELQRFGVVLAADNFSADGSPCQKNCSQFRCCTTRNNRFSTVHRGLVVSTHLDLDVSSGKYVMNHVPTNIGETFLATLIKIGQQFMIESHDVQNRSMKIV